MTSHENRSAHCRTLLKILKSSAYLGYLRFTTYLLSPAQCKRHDGVAELFINDKLNVDASFRENIITLKQKLVQNQENVPKCVVM